MFPQNVKHDRSSQLNKWNLYIEMFNIIDKYLPFIWLAECSTKKNPSENQIFPRVSARSGLSGQSLVATHGHAGSLPHRCGYRIYPVRECGTCVGKLACGSQNRAFGYPCANSRQEIFPLPLPPFTRYYARSSLFPRVCVCGCVQKCYFSFRNSQMHENAWIARRGIMIERICIYAFDFQDVFAAAPRLTSATIILSDCCVTFRFTRMNTWRDYIYAVYELYYASIIKYVYILSCVRENLFMHRIIILNGIALDASNHFRVYDATLRSFLDCTSMHAYNCITASLRCNASWTMRADTFSLWES